MTTRNDGGPAFPVTSDGRTHGSEPGMTLRDYFAAHAMQALIVSSMNSEASLQAFNNMADRTGLKVSQYIAEKAYSAADAMLEQREKS